METATHRRKPGRGSAVRAGDLVRETGLALRSAGVEHSAMDAARMVSRATGVDRCALLAHPERGVGDGEAAAVRRMAARRASGEPLQYILGLCAFWKDDFLATPDALIPRPETELLVECGAAVLEGVSRPRVLDLATGGGCVGLSILRERPDASVVATDISLSALSLAGRNASALGLERRYSRVLADGLGPWCPGVARFHLVVANPPYIAAAEWGALPPCVRDWEPRTALDGGWDGLRFYREWVPLALGLLAPGGVVLMEIGFGQGPALGRILSGSGTAHVLVRDLSGVDRVFAAGAGRDVEKFRGRSHG